MDPFTIMLAVIAAGGSLYKGFADSAAAELQGKVAAENTKLLAQQAEIAELGVDVALAKGAFTEMRLRQKVGQVLAAQPGHYAAAGLSATALSPLVQAAYSAAQGQADVEIVRANTAIEVAAARTQAANIYGAATTSAYQELAAEQREFSSIVSGIFGAGTSFLNITKPQAVTAAAGMPLNLTAPGTV